MQTKNPESSFLINEPFLWICESKFEIDPLNAGVVLI